MRLVSGQLSVVVVTWPAVTVVVPVSVSRLKKPLHAVGLPLPGTQSFTFEFVLALARVSVWSPITAPVALNAFRGNDASIDTEAPLAQAITKHVCCALPTVEKVPSGRSTWT